MRDARSRFEQLRGLFLALIAVLVFASVSPATMFASPAAKIITISGLVDCGRASGQACVIGDTVRIRTTDLTGNSQVIVIDISWIRGSLPSLDQDDLIYVEIDEITPGQYQALNLTPSESPKPPAKEDDDHKDRPNTLPDVVGLRINDVTVTQPLFLALDGPDSRPGNDTLLAKSLDARGVPELPAVTATFTVSLSSANSESVTVKFRTRDGSAEGGSTCDLETDYISTAGTLTFAPGKTQQTIDVIVCPGFFFNETEESFEVELSNAQNAIISDARGIGTILPGDPCVGRHDDGTADEYFLKFEETPLAAC